MTELEDPAVTMSVKLLLIMPTKVSTSLFEGKDFYRVMHGLAQTKLVYIQGNHCKHSIVICGRCCG